MASSSLGWPFTDLASRSPTCKAARLGRQPAPADVTAAESAWKVDRVYGLVSQGARRQEVGGPGADVQHASAGGDQGAVGTARRPGMEHHHFRAEVGVSAP